MLQHLCIAGFLSDDNGKNDCYSMNLHNICGLF